MVEALRVGCTVEVGAPVVGDGASGVDTVAAYIGKKGKVLRFEDACRVALVAFRGGARVYIKVLRLHVQAPKPVVATAMNVDVLREVFKGHADVAPNAVRAVDAPHLRRCLKAGLVQVVGRELVLTAAGVAKLGGAK